MKTANRILPPEKISGQLLVNALIDSGYLKMIVMPQDINDDSRDEKRAYVITKTDLFYIEDNRLEELTQLFIRKSE